MIDTARDDDMVSIVSAEILKRADAASPCRQRQLHQLAIYYNHHFPSPPTLVIHGLPDTGKLGTTVALLEANKIDHAVVKSRECLSQRHLLGKVFATCARCVGGTEYLDRSDRVDSLNSLVVGLKTIFENRPAKFVLIIDNVNKQRGQSQTLLPGLARLGNQIPNFSLILVSSSSRSIDLHQPGVPFIHFPPYTRTEAVTMITMRPAPMPVNLSEYFPDFSLPQLGQIYESFVTTVYDTLTTHTSSISIVRFRQTCNRLWPRFIWPAVSKETLAHKNMQSHVRSRGTQWDFARLLAQNRSLFQSEGEEALLLHLSTDGERPWTFEDLTLNHQHKQQASHTVLTSSEPKQETPLLKSFSTLLLTSAYLASHTPPKHDIILFSRLSSSSTNKRKYLTSALSKSRSSISGVRKTPTKKKANGIANNSARIESDTPSKRRKSVLADEGEKGYGEGLAKEKTPKSTRLLLEKTSNIPRPFILERVIAILCAIHPSGLSTKNKGAADRIYAEMAELERLRLVVRCGSSGDFGNRVVGGGDDGVLEEKWRVNVSRDFVVGMGSHWGISLEGWEID